ncbi:MAG: hypothetical protein KDA32_08185 [Phycisphaerales bacterium]|nr:hypothetical protein [Phycisphaerales bacterium]
MTDFAARRAMAPLGATLMFVMLGPIIAFAQTPTVRSTPDALVDLARDFALRRGGAPSAQDATHVRLLLEAAARLDPKNVDAQRWLFELATLRGESEVARKTLETLTGIEPDNETVMMRWLEVGSQGQTAEDRTTWLRKQVGSLRGPRMQAIAYVRLAEMELEQLNLDPARELLAAAAKMDDENPRVAALRWQLIPADASSDERFETTLRAFERNPTNPRIAWAVGVILDDSGYHNEAFLFFEHALRLAPDMSGSAEKLALAENAVRRGDFAAAEAYVTTVARGGDAPDLWMFAHWLMRKQGLRRESSQVLRSLQSYFAKADREDASPALRTQAAWFYCEISPDAAKALTLATRATEAAPDDKMARRALGWAQALSGDIEQARTSLASVADQDAWAAAKLAQIQREAADDAAAEQTLASLKAPPTAGPAYEALLALDADRFKPVAGKTRHPEIADRLAKVDSALFAAALHPEQFVTARVDLDDRDPDIAQPWRATFTLTNTGPYEVTLGPDGVINPTFLLSFSLRGEKDREYANALSVAYDGKLSIASGETLSVSKSIDVGAPARVCEMTPQQIQHITLTTLLDPSQDAEGAWHGQAVPALRFTRTPAPNEAEAWAARFAALRSIDPPAQIRAVEEMARLLGESQRAARGKLGYATTPIPREAAEQALTLALRSGDWELQSRTLLALRYAGLTQALATEAERSLRNPHWLPRVLALRLLARQGAAFKDAAAKVATEDSDELVRAFAAMIVDTLSNEGSAD